MAAFIKLWSVERDAVATVSAFLVRGLTKLTTCCDKEGKGEWDLEG
jgi:hypothetical protein